MNTQHDPALTRIQHAPASELDHLRMVLAWAMARRALGYTARGALVLAYIAPCFLRTPDKSRPCPSGWREVMLTNQGHTALNGVWWVCDEAWLPLQLRFAAGGTT